MRLSHSDHANITALASNAKPVAGNRFVEYRGRKFRVDADGSIILLRAPEGKKKKSPEELCHR